jgi:hypothetical protein
VSSDTSAAIAAIATCVQAILLIAAAAIAYRQVQEARRIREEQAQPYIAVSLQTDPTSPFMLNLVIENMGKTVAREVFVTFKPEIISSLDREGDANRISEWTALKEGIRTLVPGQSMSTLVDSLMSRYAGGGSPELREKVRATVRYTGDGESSKSYTYEYDLDFNVFFGQHWVGRKGIDDLVESVDEIRKIFKDWTTNRGLTVYGKDLDKLRAEKTAEMEELKARWAEQNRSTESENGSDAEINTGNEGDRRREHGEIQDEATEHSGTADKAPGKDSRLGGESEKKAEHVVGETD